MITALIITLFLIQLIMIFVIIILNSKISKFKDLEIRQNQLIEEMDNTISVYLLEMKDENDRLIEELKKSKESEKKSIPPVQKKSLQQKEVKSYIEKNISNSQLNSTKVEEPSEMEATRVFVPVQRVANAYTKQKTNTIEESETKELNEVQAELLTKTEKSRNAQKEVTFEQKVVELYKEGKTIEEIAKQLQRGKTEIELFIKFHV